VGRVGDTQTELGIASSVGHLKDPGDGVWTEDGQPGQPVAHGGGVPAVLLHLQAGRSGCQGVRMSLTVRCH
jgi:hypothetical protein